MKKYYIIKLCFSSIILIVSLTIGIFLSFNFPNVSYSIYKGKCNIVDKTRYPILLNVNNNTIEYGYRYNVIVNLNNINNSTRNKIYFNGTILTPIKKHTNISNCKIIIINTGSEKGRIVELDWTEVTSIESYFKERQDNIYFIIALAIVWCVSIFLVIYCIFDIYKYCEKEEEYDYIAL